MFTRNSTTILALTLGMLRMTASAATCESLASLNLPDTTITSALAVAAGALPSTGQGKQAQSFSDLPAFCRVAATMKPSPDSVIKMELWLPDAATWNGNFEANGNGGWNGNIAAGTLATGMRRGYAAAMTD